MSARRFSTSTSILAYNLGALIVILALPGCSGQGSDSGSEADTSAQTSTSPLSAANTQASGFQPASISLSWSIPTQREDGSALPVGEISGYEVALIDEGSRRVSNYSINDPLQNTILFEDLDPGNYELAVFAFDTENNVSSPSTTTTLNLDDFPRN